MTLPDDHHPIARLRIPDGGVFLLYAGRSARLGRSAGNEVVVDDPKVSRRHAVIEWGESGFAIHDLGSSNGTFVNGERVLESQARLLRDGDEIRLSKRLLVFEIVRAESSDPVSGPAQTSAPVMQGPRLCVSTGPDRGQVYPLWGEMVTIGRAGREATWEIRLADSAVARPHACIELCEGEYTLRDLGSAGGTTLNGKCVERPTALHAGDVVGLGETCLVFYPQ